MGSLTKKQAIEAMLAGKKVAHQYFTDEEWMRYDGAGRIEFEDGCLCFPHEFWEIRQGSDWEAGWRVWKRWGRYD